MFDLLKGWIKKEELDIAGDDNAIPSSNVVFAVNEEPRDENEVFAILEAQISDWE